MDKALARKMLSALDRSPSRSWIILVLGVALIERIALVWLYQAIPYSDTPSYRRLAQAVLEGFSRYDGTRTPGYPLLLAAFGPDERVWLVQMIMGIAVTFLMFYIGWLISGRVWFGGILALVHTLNLGQLFFEANLLSETATTFWLFLSVAGTVYWLYRPQRQKLWLGIGLGITASMTWLTRPLFIYLPFWIFLFLVPWKRREGWLTENGTPGGIAAFVVISLAMILGWAGFIHDRYHQWGLTTMTGYHMIQHTGEFFEYVPDRYADLRETYLKYRDARIAQHGTQANTIWEAIPELQAVTGKSFYDLSRLLAQISVDLIRQHPRLYLENVIEGWWMFWRVPVYWSPESFRWERLLPGLRFFILIERLASFGFNLIFVVTSILAAFWRKARSAWHVGAALWCILGTVWIASILQTLMDHGDNPRFLVPMQSLVVLWVLWVCYQTLLNWSKMQPSGDP